jgi:hypothetical protein
MLRAAYTVVFSAKGFTGCEPVDHIYPRQHRGFP